MTFFFIVQREAESRPGVRAGWHPGEIDVTVTMDHRSDLMSRTSWVEDWAQRGACGSSDPDALFVQGAAQQQAKTVCLGCPVIAECLADALDNRTEFGVWGGMTERERRALLKRRPDIRSGRTRFESARAREDRPA
jgi:WhiB family transcriptional regulator, redox-sensing transcriptional regulator